MLQLCAGREWRRVSRGQHQLTAQRKAAAHLLRRRSSRPQLRRSTPFPPTRPAARPRWQVAYSDRKKRMAVLVSKLDHCLYDLLIRHNAGELDCDIPVVISNHPGGRAGGRAGVAGAAGPKRAAAPRLRGLAGPPGMPRSWNVHAGPLLAGRPRAACAECAVLLTVLAALAPVVCADLEEVAKKFNIPFRHLPLANGKDPAAKAAQEVGMWEQEAGRCEAAFPC